MTPNKHRLYLTCIHVRERELIKNNFLKGLNIKISSMMGPISMVQPGWNVHVHVGIRRRSWTWTNPKFSKGNQNLHHVALIGFFDIFYLIDENLNQIGQGIRKLQPIKEVDNTGWQWKSSKLWTTLHSFCTQTHNILQFSGKIFICMTKLNSMCVVRIIFFLHFISKLVR